MVELQRYLMNQQLDNERVQCHSFQVKHACDEYGIHHVPYRYLCGEINALDRKLRCLLHPVLDVATSSRHQITFGLLAIYRQSQLLHT